MESPWARRWAGGSPMTDGPVRLPRCRTGPGSFLVIGGHGRRSRADGRWPEGSTVRGLVDVRRGGPGSVERLEELRRADRAVLGNDVQRAGRVVHHADRGGVAAQVGPAAPGAAGGLLVDVDRVAGADGDHGRPAAGGLRRGDLLDVAAQVGDAAPTVAGAVLVDVDAVVEAEGEDRQAAAGGLRRGDLLGLESQAVPSAPGTVLLP